MTKCKFDAMFDDICKMYALDKIDMNTFNASIILMYNLSNDCPRKLKKHIKNTLKHYVYLLMIN